MIDGLEDPSCTDRHVTQESDHIPVIFSTVVTVRLFLASLQIGKL